jgi:hypothetical protein
VVGVSAADLSEKESPSESTAHRGLGASYDLSMLLTVMPYFLQRHGPPGSDHPPLGIKNKTKNKEIYEFPLPSISATLDKGLFGIPPPSKCAT